MKFKSIIVISDIIKNKVPEKYLLSFEEFLLSGSIFTEASEFLAWTVIFMLVTEIILVIISFAFNLPSSILFVPLVIFPGYTHMFL